MFTVCHVKFIVPWGKYSLITLKKVFVFNEHIHIVVHYKVFRHTLYRRVEHVWVEPLK